MTAIQQMGFRAVGENTPHEVVEIGAHGAATEALGPYFIQITASLMVGRQRKWQCLSMTLDNAKALIADLTKAVEHRQGVTNGDATIEQMKECFKIK